LHTYEGPFAEYLIFIVMLNLVATDLMLLRIYDFYCCAMFG